MKFGSVKMKFWGIEIKGSTWDTLLLEVWIVIEAFLPVVLANVFGYDVEVSVTEKKR